MFLFFAINSIPISAKVKAYFQYFLTSLAIYINSYFQTHIHLTEI